MKLNVLKKDQLINQVDLGTNVLPQDYTETEFLIGRSVDCHIVLDDKKVSREHAKIVHSHGQWYIEKVNTENFCLVNGESFNRHYLVKNDVVKIDQFTIEVTEVKNEPTTAFKNEETSIAEKQELNFAPITPVSLPTKEKEVAEVEDDLYKDPTVTDVMNESENAPLASETSKESSRENEEELENQDGFLNDDFGEAHAEEALLNEHQGDHQEEYQEEYQEAYQEGYDENLPVEADHGDEGTKVIQSFVSVHLELFGDNAPYDKYIIDKDEIYIGRDPSKCQIVLQDGEVSSVHAVIRRSLVNLTLEDLNSSNGTLHNGHRINKSELHHNDEFVIGSVAFTVKFKSDFLKEESSMLMPVDENQTVEVEEVVEVHEEVDDDAVLGEGESSAVQEKSIIKRVWKDEKKRKQFLIALVVLVGAYVMLDEDKPDVPKAPVKKVTTEKKIETNSKVLLTDAQREEFSNLYEVGKTHYENGRYREALTALEKISVVDPNFRENLQTLIVLSKDGLKKLEELERERLAKIQAQEKKLKVEKLLESAREYTKDRKVDLANSVFDEIIRIDPDNIEVSRLRLELDNWVEEQRRIALEAAQKKKDREDKVAKLQPAKALYLQKEWFQAINKLQEFLDIKNMDEDLIKEATEMLRISKEELDSSIAPLVGKAKSLKEGQDLKGAYNVYAQILKFDPTNTEAIQEMEAIKETLTNKAKKIYRDAIISESLSLFQDAKEKFQEVQQISPVDSEYYIKATEKLKYYLE